MAELLQVVLQVIRLLWSVLYLLLPIKATLVLEGQTGVRFTLGRPGRNLGPGLHFALTFQTLTCVHTRLCTSPLDSIRLMLKDGVPISANGVLTYEITQLGHYLTHSENTDWLISEFAEASLRHQLSGVSFNEFHTSPMRLDAAVKDDLQGLVDEAELGVTIRNFRINDFVVLCRTTRTALAQAAIIEAIGKISPDVADDPSFGAKVALVAGAIATNQVASTPSAAAEGELVEYESEILE